MGFDKNVFINCPFDTDYFPLLRPLLFTAIDLGMTPQIALDGFDSGKPRIDKIVALIKSSRYAIHDLSRMRAEKVGEYYRLNMPFELGLDVGCRLFTNGNCSSKQCLILEAKKYRYRAAISDLSGSDIAVHKNKPVQLVTEVRNWLNKEAKLRAPGAAKVWTRFNSFMAFNYDSLIKRGYSRRNIQQQPIGEVIDCMKDWKHSHP